MHHFAGAVEGLPSALAWLENRFAGRTSVNSCALLPVTP
ncbi:lipase family protein [Luteipulveratus sp. YIM 133132]|nr:lipase family protein [Luteipulveratus sp. YIM 133132]MDE9366633.1 lipase family protein [Luteipulveratus sp. YIM 133132]